MTSDDARRTEQIRENIIIGETLDEPQMPAILTLDEMLARLVWIGEQGLVADIDTGRIRKKHMAIDEYAASLHRYIIDDKEKVEPALKSWLKNPSRKGTDVLAWVPGAGRFCSPPEPKQPNELAFNTWRGLQRITPPDDWSLRVRSFLTHVEYLVPIESERKRFLCWLAHIVQKPEVLPHTYYLMITETTGIGRNLLMSMLVRVLRGHVAANVDLPELLDGGGYTGRLSQKLLVTVDEAYEGGGQKRYQRANRLKSLITEAHRNINHKYGFQVVEMNCCRWLMCSNHWDAIPFDDKDRRCIVIENPKVQKEAAYYERLYAMLADQGFIGSIRYYLETLAISEFKPGEHAPLNAAKQQTLDRMRSELDQVLINFKDECTAELTARSKIRKLVDWAGIGDIKENDLSYAIARVGMINTGRRIRIKDKDYGVIIVKGPWTPELVKSTPHATLEEIIEPQVRERDWRPDRPRYI